MTTNKEMNRHFLPYPKFKVGQGDGEKHIRDIGPILGLQHVLQCCDEGLALNLSRAFEEDSFDAILEAIADLYNVPEESVLILDSSADNFQFRSYFESEFTNKEYIKLGAEFSKTLGNSWVFNLNLLDKKELIDFIEEEFEVIIDIKALAVWVLRPDHPSYEVNVVKPQAIGLQQRPIYLSHPIEFTIEQYKQIYDEFQGVEGAFKASSRGLRVYNPIEKEFVKFNKKTSRMKTTASTLLFRQSYNSFYYVFEVDLVNQKISKRYYESNYAEALGRYRETYEASENTCFSLFGNE